jgi:hypothetical protein
MLCGVFVREDVTHDKTPVLVFSAHPDDWQIFAGSAIYEHVRDPQTCVSIINLTAGDAGEDAYHWKSRHAGAVLSVLRALPSWSPYSLGDFAANPLPSSFSVLYGHFFAHGKTVLRTTLCDRGRVKATIYSLHLPDGRPDGSGFHASGQSLAKLREGRCLLSSLWPEDDFSVYASWNDLLAMLEAIVAEACGAYTGSVRVYAPNTNPEENPDDHSDHHATGLAVRELLATMPSPIPIWMSMYAVAYKAENLVGNASHAQRAAITAYGAGYASTAAGVRTEWRRGWEREAEAFKNRQYLRSESGAHESGH